MIITESFVFLHYPKTGGQFIQKALFELYRRYSEIGRVRRWLERRPKRTIQEIEVPGLRLRRASARRGLHTLHGTYDQIPGEFRSLPVLACYREPLDRLESAYFYADWKRKEVLPAPLEEIRSAFPEFPDLSFSQFVEYLFHFGKYEIKVGGQSATIGPLSADLLKFFAKSEIDPDELIFYQSWEELDRDLPEIRFLSQQRLNEDLIESLSKLGHRPGDLSFIRGMDRINRSSRDEAVGADEREEVSRRIHGDPLFDKLLNRLVDRKPLTAGFGP